MTEPIGRLALAHDMTAARRARAARRFQEDPRDEAITHALAAASAVVEAWALVDQATGADGPLAVASLRRRVDSLDLALNRITP